MRSDSRFAKIARAVARRGEKFVRVGCAAAIFTAAFGWGGGFAQAAAPAEDENASIEASSVESVDARFDRAASFAREGRNVEAEDVLKAFLAEAPDDSAARCKARKELMVLYLKWGHPERIDPVWAEFAADTGDSQSAAALGFAEKCFERKDFVRALAAYELAASSSTSATAQSVERARLGAALARSLTNGATDLAEFDGLASTRARGVARDEFYAEAGQALLEAEAPSQALDLFARGLSSAPGVAGRIEALAQSGQFDEAEARSLAALRAYPAEVSVANAAAKAMRSLPKDTPDLLKQGKAFFDQAINLTQGNAAMRVHGEYALFLASQGERDAALGPLDSLQKNFAGQSAMRGELDRVAREWRIQKRHVLEAKVYERLVPLTEGDASLVARRKTVQAYAAAQASDEVVSKTLGLLFEFDHPKRNAALIDATDEMIGGGAWSSAQATCEFVEAHSPTRTESDLAQALMSSARMCRAEWERNPGETIETNGETAVSGEAARRVANDAFKTGNRETALAMWQRTVDESPENPGFRTGLIEANLSLGDADEALSVVANLPPDTRDRTLRIWRAALKASRRGQGQTAATFSDNLKEIEDGDVVLLGKTCRAIAALESDPKADVSDVSEDLLALRGAAHETAAALALAEALRVAERFDIARPLYERVADLASGGKDEIRARAALAAIEAEEGSLTTEPLASHRDLSDAIARKLIDIGQEYREAVFNLNVRDASDEQMARYRHFIERKLAACETVGRRSGGSAGVMPCALMGMGEALRSIERYDEAAAAFERLASEYPDHPYAPLAMYRAGKCHSMRRQQLRYAGDLPAARAEAVRGRETFQECVRLYPDAQWGVASRKWVTTMQKKIESIDHAIEVGEISAGKEKAQ